MNGFCYIKGLVGRRVLIKNPEKAGGGVTEYKILEVSPNGEYVKIEGIVGLFAGRTEWQTTSEIDIYQILDEPTIFLKGGTWVPVSDLLNSLSLKQHD